MANILLPSNGRAGVNKMRNEAAFRTSLAAGDEVYTTLNNVYFSVKLGDDGQTLVYAALVARPPNLNDL